MKARNGTIYNLFPYSEKTIELPGEKWEDCGWTFGDFGVKGRINVFKKSVR